ncbi:MAG: phosphocholine cytidylyltransferase family protein [Sphingomonas bacterium]|jgi:choline kinase|nr:phosphocholine cytidylyltransferase family protein [Sphingomonas bacterium]MDB5717600.1 phosphocholine cytidylyltransferase family protein [Sphingomonas bacterium]
MTIDKAIILSAGKGSRLYPYTEDRPKCLLELSGRTLLEWQLDALHACGISEMVVVTGFHHDMVAQVIAARGQDRGRVRTLFNPFYHVADNLGSVWMARGEFDRDVLLLNGDTLVSPALVDRVLASGDGAITVTVDIKDSYDADDMKVLREGDRLLRIGKLLAAHECNAESIGLLAFRGEGGGIFVEAVERIMHTPEGTASWYLRVIDGIAETGVVGTVSIEGERWQEVDYLTDLEAARTLTAEWARAGHQAGQ